MFLFVHSIVFRKINKEKFLNELNSNKTSMLNVAGDRESSNPGICEKVIGFLINILTHIY